MLLKMAFRNILRNPKRTLLTMITAVVGIVGFINSSALVRGVEQSTIRIDIKTESGHLRVMKKGYLKEEESFPLDYLVDKPEEIQTAILKKEPKAWITPRIIFSANIGDGIHSLPVRGIAVDPNKADKAYRFSSVGQTKKRLPSDGNFIWIGQSLAKTFHKKVGETLTLLTRTQSGSLNAIDFVIHDILNTGNMTLDAFTVFVSMKTGRSLLQMPKGLTQLVVHLPSKEQSIDLAKIVSAISPNNFAQTWQNKSQEIIELNKLRRKIFNFLITMILLVAAAGIANTMLMSGFERKGEIGMMTAIGMPTQKIIQLFALEAGFLGVFASIMGLLLGVPLALYGQVHGIDISSRMDNMAGSANTMSLVSVMHLELTWEMVIVGGLIGVVVSVVASLWPAWKVTRLEPREILSRS